MIDFNDYDGVLIGSRAINYHAPELIGRVNDKTDWDIITNHDKSHFENFNGRVEVHSFDQLNNRDVCECHTHETSIIEKDGYVFLVMGVHGLVIMKRSHLYRDWFFEKHMSDYNKIIDKFGMHKQVIRNDYNCDNRFNLTKKAYKQPNPNLNQSNEEFFDDVVEKKYDHDLIHEYAAYNDQPMYTLMKRDHTLAKCEKDMWEEFSHEQKIQCVCEETYVIACERFMIPNEWKFGKLRAYNMALKKVCTTLTSGWFRDFAIDNFEEITKMFRKEKIDLIRYKLEQIN